MILTKTATVNRNFENVFNELFSATPATPRATSNMPVNILEGEKFYRIELSAPGRNKEDFSIKLEKNFLTIGFEQKQDSQSKDFKSILKEFSVANFQRTFSLDKKINSEAIEARYENGILYVTLPKKEEINELPKQIQVA